MFMLLLYIELICFVEKLPFQKQKDPVFNRPKIILPVKTKWEDDTIECNDSGYCEERPI